MQVSYLQLFPVLNTHKGIISLDADGGIGQQAGPESESQGAAAI